MTLKMLGLSKGCLGAATAAFLALGALPALGAGGADDLIVRLRLSGESSALAPLRACVVEKLSQQPDVKVATAPTDGARFVIDIVASKDTGEAVSASLVVVQTFPMEAFRPRIKEGEDATALLKSIQFYTLLRLHEVVPAQANDALCTRIVTDIRDKVLMQEFTERAD
jgi:hypothetical protein